MDTHMKEQALHRLLFTDTKVIFGAGLVLLDADSRFIDSGGTKDKPDLIAVDQSGRLIIVEAKVQLANETEARKVIAQANRYAINLGSRAGKKSIYNLRHGYYSRYENESVTFEQSTSALLAIENSKTFRGWNWSHQVVIVVAGIKDNMRDSLQTWLPDSRTYYSKAIEVCTQRTGLGKLIIASVRDIFPELPPDKPYTGAREDSISVSTQHIYHQLSPFFGKVDQDISCILSDMPIDAKLRAKEDKNWWKIISFMHPWGLQLGGLQFEISLSKGEPEVRLLCGGRPDLAADLYQPLLDAKEQIAKQMGISHRQLTIEKKKFVIKCPLDPEMLSKPGDVAKFAASFVRAVYPIVQPIIW